MKWTYSFIVPVYNRPNEVLQLLDSISALSGAIPFEVVVIEDGSSVPCRAVCDRFRESVPITYHYKENSGPGDSRNYGMRVAQGYYFIILDSDCIVPSHYLEVVDAALKEDFVHCYGGPDAALDRFTNVQKAINYTMTSFLTTGGIRGGKKQVDTFQPRSFNMGLSREAFEHTGGFGVVHPGEDPDLVMRLWNAGYKTKLIPDAFVYHERRISWKLFYKQVKKFGMVRVILTKWHPSSARFTYFIPSLFLIGLFVSMVLLFFKVYLPLVIYVIYFLVLSIDSALKNNIVVGFYSMFAALIQFTGYGYGFMQSFYRVVLQRQTEQEAFPILFFKQRNQ